MSHLQALSTMCLNGIGNTGDFLLRNSGSTLVSASLGYLGGVVTGVGPQIGLLYGTLSGLVHRAIHIPMHKYIEANSKNEGPINNNAAYFLKGSLIIFCTTLPVLMTQFLSASIKNLTNAIPGTSLSKWLFTPSPTRNYTLVAGIGAAILLKFVQYGVSDFFEEGS